MIHFNRFLAFIKSAKWDCIFFCKVNICVCSNNNDWLLFEPKINKPHFLAITYNMKLCLLSIRLTWLHANTSAIYLLSKTSLRQCHLRVIMCSTRLWSHWKWSQFTWRTHDRRMNRKVWKYITQETELEGWVGISMHSHKFIHSLLGLTIKRCLSILEHNIMDFFNR